MAIRRAQVEHFLQLLKEGWDAREEGVSWIIKELWKLKEAVPISAFPNFLDDGAVQYLIEYAQKSLEYDEIKTIYEDLKSKLKYLREGTKNSNGKSKDSLNKISEVKSKLQHMCKKVKVKKIRNRELTNLLNSSWNSDESIAKSPNDDNSKSDLE